MDLAARITKRLLAAADMCERTGVEVCADDGVYVLARQAAGRVVPLLSLDDIARIAAQEAER